jgi:hypothetical protein
MVAAILLRRGAARAKPLCLAVAGAGDSLLDRDRCLDLDQVFGASELGHAEDGVCGWGREPILVDCVIVLEVLVWVGEERLDLHYVRERPVDRRILMPPRYPRTTLLNDSLTSEHIRKTIEAAGESIRAVAD